MRTFRLLSATLFLFCFSLLAAGQVRADSVSYVYQFAGNTFAWVLPTDPVPSSFAAGMSFTITNVSFTENGGPATVGTVDFFNGPSNLGGFDLYVGSCCTFLVDAEGPQLYTNTENAPSLSAGTFTVTDFVNTNTPQGTGTLQATSVSTTIPEPSTILLSAIGLVIGLALGVLRKN